MANAIETRKPEPRVTIPASPLDLPAETFRAGLGRRKANRELLMEWIRSALVEGVDYGRIPTRQGLSKPSLWKPGAEKICGMLGVTVHFPTLPDYEQAALRGAKIENVILRCELRDSAGRVVADGVGARRVSQDGGDLNKALKMAEKSAHIDATLRMAGLSEVFTQDLEDMAGEAKAQEPILERRITPAQHRHLETQIQKLGLDRARVKAWVAKAWGIENLDRLPVPYYKPLLARLRRWSEQTKAKTKAELAYQEQRQAALETAKRWGWSGEMEDLPKIIRRIEESAANISKQARYADRSYEREIRRAEALARLARELQQIHAQHQPAEKA